MIMIYFYNTVLLLFSIPALLFVLIRQRKRLKEFSHRFGERLGSWEIPSTFTATKPLLWIHCASLGEVRAAEPLLRELGEFHILLTTITLSGREYAEKNKLADLIYYAPLDFSFLVKRAILGLKPRGLLLIETELWPGMIDAAAVTGAKIVLVNGRLSAHSFPAYNALRWFWKHILKHINCIAARSKEDASRFASLGFRPEKIIVTGNIKYDREFPLPDFSRVEFGFRDTDLVWTIGSTRDGEEELLVEAWKSLRRNYPSLRVVIAPRHLNRVHEIRSLLLKKGVKYRLRSRGTGGAFDWLIVDTFGELQKFYAMADVAYVGGSMVDKGGQNPIEPAAYAKPVFFGPYMDNFLTEANVLEERGGGFRMQDPAELAAQLDRVLADKNYRSETGRKALEAVESQKGALSRTVTIIKGAVSFIR